MKEKKLFEESRKATKQFYTMPKVIQHAPIPTLQNTSIGPQTVGQLSLERIDLSQIQQESELRTEPQDQLNVLKNINILYEGT